MKKRFEVLDIFRGLFCLFVVLYHMSAFSNTPIINNNFIDNSDLFVDFFFVLSGFVIAHCYSSISNFNQFKSYFTKRLYRLYPLHLIMLLVFVLIEFSKIFLSSYVHVNKLVDDNNNVITFFTSLFLVNSIKILNIKAVSWNIVSWSISAEMISYLTFGLLSVLISFFKLKNFKILVFILILFISAYTLHKLTKTYEIIYTFDYGFLRGIIGFFTGVLCLNLYTRLEYTWSSIRKIWFDIAEVAVFVCIIITLWFGLYFKQFGYIYEILFFIAVLIFSFEKGFLSNNLKKFRVLHQLGKYSYSIYMIHPLLLSLFNIVFIRLFKLPANAYSYLFILNLILIYFVSTVTYKYIEMFFQNKKLYGKQKAKLKEVGFDKV